MLTVKYYALTYQINKEISLLALHRCQ